MDRDPAVFLVFFLTYTQALAKLLGPKQLKMEHFFVSYLGKPNIWRGARFVLFGDNAKDLPSCKYLLAPKRFRSRIHLYGKKENNLLKVSIFKTVGWFGCCCRCCWCWCWWFWWLLLFMSMSISIIFYAPYLAGVDFNLRSPLQPFPLFPPPTLNSVSAPVPGKTALEVWQSKVSQWIISTIFKPGQ